MIAILLQDINAREMKMYVHTEISKYAASGNGVFHRLEREAFLETPIWEELW